MGLLHSPRLSRIFRSPSTFVGTAAAAVCLPFQHGHHPSQYSEDGDDVAVVYEKMVKLSLPLLQLQAWGVEVFVAACEQYEMVSLAHASDRICIKTSLDRFSDY
jgi:hypothetical protein